MSSLLLAQQVLGMATMNELAQLLNAIDAAYRIAIRAGEKDIAKLLLMASLGVSQKMEAAKQNAG